MLGIQFFDEGFILGSFCCVAFNLDGLNVERGSPRVLRFAFFNDGGEKGLRVFSLSSVERENDF